MQKKIADGSFVKIEYKGTISLTGEVFDLTSEEEAKKEGIHNPNTKYGPQLVIIGSGMTVPGVEEQLREMKPGDEKEFDVSKEKGFGIRNPKLIKVVSYQKFVAQKMNPVPGMYVNIEGRHAKISAVSGGRVRVDFNSPLAGKDLHYRVKVVKIIEDTQEKAQSLLDHYGIGAKAGYKEGTLGIGTKQKMNPQVQQLLNMQFKKWLPEVKKIDYLNPSKDNNAKNTETQPANEKKTDSVKEKEPVKTGGQSKEKASSV